MGKKQIICIDESGGFEVKEGHARFLGGCIFTGNPAEEERKLAVLFRNIAARINEKFQMQLQGCKCNFPQSFHMSELTVSDSDGQLRKIENRDLTRAVRREILASVKEYLSQRSKNYRLFALVVPFQNAVGHKKTSHIREFSLTDFRNPGVLYERLITGAVHNFTFYSLETDVEKNIFKLASRTPTIPKNELTQEQLQSLRDVNQVWIDDRNQVHLTQTNINTFKASLSEKMFEGKAINRLAIGNMEIDCRSINYMAGDSAGISPFFYLSDILCYYLQRMFYGEQKNEYYKAFQMNQEALERVRNACVVPCMFWAYEETDSLFKNGIEAYAAGKLAECFGALYDMEHASGKCVDYYRGYWEKKLLQVICETYEKKKNEEFVNHIPEDLAYLESLMQHQAEYRKAEYILTKLEAVIENGGYDLKPEQDYQLQDLFLRIHNHHGSVAASRKYFKRLLTLRHVVSTETFMSSVNRAAQIYFNQFAYEPLVTLYEFLLEEARQIKDSYQRQDEMIGQLIEEVFGESMQESEGKNQFEWLGKMYSSIGQAYAFQGNYNAAKENFDRAVEEFSTESNRSRTMGYLLHAMIDACPMRDNLGKDSFPEEKTSLSAYLVACSESGMKSEKIRPVTVAALGSDDVRDLLKGNLKDEITGFARFNLYIWIKAVYKLGIYQCREGRKEVRKLAELVQAELSQESKAQSYCQHPWELIFKYLYLICRDSQDKELQEKAGFFAEQCRKEWPDAEETIHVIKAVICCQFEEDSEKRRVILAHLREMSAGIEGLKGLEQAEDQEKYLYERVTYMYR